MGGTGADVVGVAVIWSSLLSCVADFSKVKLQMAASSKFIEEYKIYSYTRKQFLLR